MPDYFVHLIFYAVGFVLGSLLTFIQMKVYIHSRKR